MTFQTVEEKPFVLVPQYCEPALTNYPCQVHGENLVVVNSKGQLNWIRDHLGH